MRELLWFRINVQIVVLQVLIEKMAQVIVSLRIMPDSPEADLKAITDAATQKINEFSKDDGDKKIEEVPVAFGLKALQILFVMDEDIGSTDPLENDLATIEHVQSVQITDVRRAMG